MSRCCFSGGDCIRVKAGGFKCRCKAGFTGHLCQQQSFGFGPRSYAELGTINATWSAISVEFATVANVSVYSCAFGTLL